MQKPSRPASLLTGHRVRKTKHLAQQKVREKRTKEETAEEEEHHHQHHETGDVDAQDHSENSDVQSSEATAPVTKPKQTGGSRTGKRARKLDPLV